MVSSVGVFGVFGVFGVVGASVPEGPDGGVPFVPGAGRGMVGVPGRAGCAQGDREALQVVGACWSRRIRRAGALWSLDLSVIRWNGELWSTGRTGGGAAGVVGRTGEAVDDAADRGPGR